MVLVADRIPVAQTISDAKSRSNANNPDVNNLFIFAALALNCVLVLCRELKHPSNMLYCSISATSSCKSSYSMFSRIISRYFSRSSALSATSSSIASASLCLKGQRCVFEVMICHHRIAVCLIDSKNCHYSCSPTDGIRYIRRCHFAVGTVQNSACMYAVSNRYSFSLSQFLLPS